MSIALNLDHSTAIRPASAARPSLIGLSKAGLAEALVGNEVVAEKEGRMRASQLWNWLYVNGVTDFDRMTNVAKPVRQKLADTFNLDRPRSSPNRSRSMARASGCSASAIRRTRTSRRSRWRPSISPKATAGRSASPRRWDAR